MKSIKIVHIHTNKIFLIIPDYYKDPRFNNRIVYLCSRKNTIPKCEDDQIEEYSTKNKSDFNKVLAICKIASIVVLYDLDFLKCYIANRLPTSVLIVWRFFGLELYSKMPNYVYSEVTKSVLNQSTSIIKPPSRAILTFKQLLKYRTTYQREFEKAIKRIDAFAGLSELEYFFLKERWPSLPRFLQLPFLHRSITYKFILKKSNIVIVGNNKSAYNNHIDILNLIKESTGKGNYLFKMFFNYGSNNCYSQSVLALAEQITEVRVIEKFLSLAEFKNEYIKASAFVMNGYRQMAMANVIEAITNNVKIYLNTKNIIYDWLLSEGFLIFSIEQFIEDLDNANLKLTESEIHHNYYSFKRFVEKYSKMDFVNSLNDLLVT